MRISGDKIFILLLLLVQEILAKIGDPYRILSITRNAQNAEVKKAYKRLAKEWHPDKNSSPDAESKFIEINQAYELLMDPDRRQIYDRTGQTEDQPNFRKQHDYSSFKRFETFDDIFSNFGGGGGRFNFRQGDGVNIFKKQSITFKAYTNSVLELTKKQPYLILFYSDWCIACAHIEPIWRRLAEELEPINFGLATVHAGRETELASKLGVKNVPYIIMILDGHPYHYTEASLSMVSTLDFIRRKFPHKMVQRVTEDNLDNFLFGWVDNKVRVLIFGRLDIIRLRYLTLAWEFRERAVIGYVQMERSDTDSIRARYGVSNKVDTLLLFLEDSFTPAASVAMTDLPYPTMKDIIEANKYLQLPRLSSQSVFDALCPVESMRSRRRLCVVLVSEDNPIHEPPRAALREYAVSKEQRNREKERVRYTYIFKEKQVEFINSLTIGSGAPEEVSHHIVIIWRKDRHHLKYEWLEGGWKVNPDQHNNSRQTLKETIHRLLHSNEPMPFETVVQELFDEHAQGIVWRIINKLASVQDYLRENVTQDDVIPAVSILSTILFIVAGGYLMSYLVKLEEGSIEGGVKGFMKGEVKSSAPQLKMHELRGETYNGLIRMIKPGCRTIVMLCNTESKNKLMPKFHKACWPYRKNKTLMFAFLNIDRKSAMDWYKNILVLGLPEPRELNINPKNTLGTVLSLNGHRKYYCIFHAKHPEGPQRGEMSGDFMGFSDNESDSSTSDIEGGDGKKDSIASDKPLLNYYSKVLFEEQLLEGFNNWLDRLFEGTTQRYHINYWPDWPGK